ncbi:hemerythrin domain-containing protein [bacterium]|nr:hemerythrin domain-containing protein [bacterium]
MITAIQILVQEHRVIESMLLCLERLAEQAERDGKLDNERSGTIIDFLREFADACHHGKEEDVLFKFSDTRTVGHGPVEVLRDEHTEGRGYVSVMAKNRLKAVSGNPGAIRSFCESARDLTNMLRRHIQREDEVVFPMIEEQCQSSDADQLWQEFVTVEKIAGGDRHKKFVESARSCCRHFNVPFHEDHITQLIVNFG